MRCWGDEESELPGEKIQSYGYSGRDGDRVSELDEFPSPPLSKAVDCLSLLWYDGLGGKSMKFCQTAVVHFNKGDKSKVINCKGFENCDFQEN